MLSAGSLCCSIHKATLAQGVVASLQQCNKEPVASRQSGSHRTHRWVESTNRWQSNVGAKQNVVSPVARCLIEWKQALTTPPMCHSYNMFFIQCRVSLKHLALTAR